MGRAAVTRITVQKSLNSKDFRGGAARRGIEEKRWVAEGGKNNPDGCEGDASVRKGSAMLRL
jgi:hypothetical protein